MVSNGLYSVVDEVLVSQGTVHGNHILVQMYGLIHWLQAKKIHQLSLHNWPTAHNKGVGFFFDG